MYLLYRHLAEAFLIGVLIIIILIPFNTYVSSCIGRATESLMNRKDSRLGLISEILRGIASIKMQNMERCVLDLLLRKRSEEFKYLSRRKYFDVVYVFMWAVLPVLVPLASFAAANTRGIRLSVSDVFLSITLLRMLVFPLNSIPFIVNSMLESAVSLKRISSLLQATEVDDPVPTQSIFNGYLIDMTDAEFAFVCPPSDDFYSDAEALLVSAGQPGSSFTIGPITLQASAGEVIGIVGELTL
jgi:ABC-type multidrug transport system fused ATPase/permease subunit